MDISSLGLDENILFYSSGLFLVFGIATSATDHVKAVNYSDGEFGCISWVFLIPFLQILLSNGHFSSAIVIFLLIFENSVIGELDWSIDIFFISLTLLVIFQIHSNGNSIQKMPFYYGVPIISILLQLYDQLRMENSIAVNMCILLFWIWDITHNTFMLQFTFLEYYAVLVWTGITIIAGLNFMNKSVVFISYGCEEILYIVHTGIICTLGSLCSIAWFLSVIFPIKFENNPNLLPIRKVILYRGFVFIVAFVISILVIMIPSMKYILNGTDPILWIIEFLSTDSFKRSYLCLYWIGLIPLFIISAHLLAINSLWSKFCNRKLFHFLMILIITPGIFVSDLLSFTLLALGVAFCAFIFLETFRMMVLAFIPNDNITFYYDLFLSGIDTKRLVLPLCMISLFKITDFITHMYVYIYIYIYLYKHILIYIFIHRYT
jgi:hypothetical protein